MDLNPWASFSLMSKHGCKRGCPEALGSNPGHNIFFQQVTHSVKFKVAWTWTKHRNDGFSWLAKLAKFVSCICITWQVDQKDLFNLTFHYVRSLIVLLFFLLHVYAISSKLLYQAPLNQPPYAEKSYGSAGWIADSGNQAAASKYFCIAPRPSCTARH